MFTDLLKTQKNAIYEILKAYELNPVEFEWAHDGDAVPHNDSPSLEHKNSNYYFMFYIPTGNYHWQYECSPGQSKPIDKEIVTLGWEQVLDQFRLWCSNLRDELEAPDLWGSVRTFDLESIRVSPDSNDPFTYAEAEMVQDKIRQLVEFVKEESINNRTLEENQVSILASLERLEAQAKSGTGRIDWSNQLVGIIMNIIIAASFAPERTAQFLEFIHGLFHSGLNLLINS